jgi:pilus assembly protein CpaF
MSDERFDPLALRRRLAGARRAGLRAWSRGSGSDSPPAPEPGGASRLALGAELQARLLDEVEALDPAASDAAMEDAVRSFAGRVLRDEGIPLNDAERARLADDLADEALGLGPLAPLLADPAVTDVLVVGPVRIWVERFGVLERVEGVRFRDESHVRRVVERLAARVGRRIDAASPMVDLRLPDGSRVNATVPPVSPDGATISIRRFGRRRLRSSDLLRLGALSEPMWRFLALAVRQRRSVLISGGTGAGKSTLLGVLAEAIPAEERIVTIEDTLELRLEQEHVVRLETRPPNVEERGEIGARELVRNALRMRPDRIVVGEVRGAEALDMLQAMNTGHEGSLSTVHANSPRDALARLETMVLMAGLDLPSRAIREQIVAAIDLVVQVRRYEDGARRVESVAEIVGLEGETPLLQELFRFQREGRLGSRVRGSFVGLGIVPRLVEALRERGVTVPAEWFQGDGGAGR